MRRFLLVLFVVSLASPSLAAAPDPRRDALLDQVDGIPTNRAALERQLPDAQHALIQAATDETSTMYRRLRAIAFLSFYPDDTTLATLDGLLKSTVVDVRAAAVYALGRTTWVETKGNQKVADRVADIAERDPSADVREHAVRALRWVDEPAAATRLERLATTRPELAPLAQDTLARRARRLAR